MALLKCPNCDSDVSSKAVKCPSCGLKLNNTSTIEERKDQEIVIDFFLKQAKIIKIIFIIIGIISIFAGLIGIDGTDGISILIGIGACIIFIGYGIILEKLYKWKAYMLKNTYEFNTKIK